MKKAGRKIKKQACEFTISGSIINDESWRSMEHGLNRSHNHGTSKLRSKKMSSIIIVERNGTLRKSIEKNK